jgi:hypothetical protein
MADSPLTVINVARWQNKLRAMMGMGGGNPVPTLKELLPVVAVEVDRPEWGLAGNEFPWALSRSQAAVAAQLSYVALVNPPDSGLIAVVTFVGNRSVSANCDLMVGNLPASGVLPGEITNAPVVTPRDSGNGGNSGLRGSIGASIAGIQLTSQDSLLAFAAATLAASGTAPDFYAVLRPGGVCALQGQALNVAVAAMFRFRERPQERGKLT